jgi:photosystem II stability/assembly factor-like uncharacterized protein
MNQTSFQALPHLQRKSLFHFAGLLLFLLLSAGSTYARQWQKLGLDSGTVQSIAIDQHNPSRLIVGAFYKTLSSTDGGVDWDTLLPWRAPQWIAMHPDSANIIYAADGAIIMKTTDSGVSWTHADSGIIVDGLDSWGVAFAMDYNVPLMLYYGVGGFFDGPLYRSTNGGNSWIPDFRVSGHPIATSKRTAGLIFVGGTWASKLYRSSSAGLEWDTLVRNSHSIAAIELTPQNDSVLYMGIWLNGLYKSTDLGTTWWKSDTGITHTRFQKIVVDPLNASSVYVLSGSNIWSPDVGTIFHSSDAGATWRPFMDGLPAGISILTIEISPDGKDLYAGAAFSGISLGGIYRYGLVT